jgi:hypothetical protein
MAPDYKACAADAQVFPGTTVCSGFHAFEIINIRSTYVLMRLLHYIMAHCDDPTTNAIFAQTLRNSLGAFLGPCEMLVNCRNWCPLNL